MQSVKEVVNGAKMVLEKTSNSAQLDSEILMMKVLNVELYRLVMDIDRILTEEEIAEFNALVERRKLGEPVAYIIGKSEFMGFDFNVEEGVLIPRPETEELVEFLDGEYQKGKRIKGLDMCTGSGCIAISLAKLNKRRFMTAVDISDVAISIAKKNCKALKAKNVNVIQSDLFANVPKDKHNFIVSNPPYIETAEIDRLMVDVKEYEPKLALDGGRDGLDFYRRIVTEALDYLKVGGGLYFEIGHKQGKHVREMMDNSGYENIIIKKDLSGRDRFVYGFKAPQKPKKQ